MNNHNKTHSRTIADVLTYRSYLAGDKVAFSFICGDGEKQATLTFSELRSRAMAIAAELQLRMSVGERALLVYPPGLDFITAFFGCIYAGILAVPVTMPNRKRTTTALASIIDSCRPSLVLSTSDNCLQAKVFYANQPSLIAREWLATDRIDDAHGEEWRPRHIADQQAAFLQYTSGSTSHPKGVVITHKNLLSNAAVIQQAFGNTDEMAAVFWLPLHHDMGLIGGVLQPIYTGCSCTLMAPAAFLQRPALWLETISKTGAAVSGGPNFAYELCVQKIQSEEIRDLNLSRWQVAFTGAERIRAETIRQFAEKFAPCGFQTKAIFPCYGLAEATLMATGGARSGEPLMLDLNLEALAHHQAVVVSSDDTTSRTLVGCGQVLPGQDLVIVETQNREPCPDGKIGEIWIMGPSVSGSYFEQPEMTERTFRAFLSTGEGPYLRTGDLGFIKNGELFVTGRLKDLIIIRGRNYYPEDLEQSLSHADAAFRPGFCAAFSIDTEDREQLVVVQEVQPGRRNLDVEAAFETIRRIISTEHGLELFAIVLVKPGQMPKTSSGKTMRAACRSQYASGGFKVIAEWKFTNPSSFKPLPVTLGHTKARKITADEAEIWLINRISERTELPSGDVQVTTPFLMLGLGSMEAVELAAELETWLGRRMSPTMIYNHPNIGALAKWLSQPLHDEKSDSALIANTLSLEMLPTEFSLEDIEGMTDTDIENLIHNETVELQSV